VAKQEPATNSRLTSLPGFRVVQQQALTALPPAEEMGGVACTLQAFATASV